MSLIVEAVYEDGVLKPLQPIALPDGTHVSIVITPYKITSHKAVTTSKSPAEIAALPTEGMDAETEAWLEADLGGDLPPYEWGNKAPSTAGEPLFP